MLGEPFKVTAPFRTTVGDFEANCQRRTQLCQRPFIHYMYMQLFAMNKFGICFQWCNEHFYLVLWNYLLILKMPTKTSKPSSEFSFLCDYSMFSSVDPSLVAGKCDMILLGDRQLPVCIFRVKIRTSGHLRGFTV